MKFSIANLKQKCLNLLVKKMGVNLKNIIKIEYQSAGYTNNTFKVVTNDSSYIVRLGNYDKLLDRKNEKLIYSILEQKKIFKCYYFNEKNGDMIRPYINGIIPDKENLNEKLIKLIAKEIRLVHSIKSHLNKNVLINNYLQYKKYYSRCQDKFVDLYKFILKKNKNLDLVLSHNDLSNKNIIYNKVKHTINFIDFEWSRLNNRYFDLANIVKDLGIHNSKYEDMLLKEYGHNLKKTTLTEFIYVSAFFSYLWTFSIHSYRKIISYRKESLLVFTRIYDELTK